MEKPDPNKPFGKSLADLTDEEYEELAQGVDDYFAGLQPGRAPEHTDEPTDEPGKRSGEEAKKSEGGPD